MSGHNKWSSIKHRKAAQDAKRGKAFTKFIREITVAAKNGDDLESNAPLRAAVASAKAANMPNDTINRAIAKGVGNTDTSAYEEVVYEGYGPASVAVVVECLTDNRNRTAGAVRHSFTKYGGALGSSNSVLFMFDRKGVIYVAASSTDEDSLTEKVLEAGGDDIELDGENFMITCAMEDFYTVRASLEEQGVEIGESGLERIPQNRVEITDKDQAEKVLAFIDMLEDDDDVQNVFTNFDLSEEVAGQLE